MRKKIFDWCLTTVTAFVLSSFMALAQTGQITVTGVVSSSGDGEPMVGVTVQVKGTTVGTVTDVNGRYEIRASKGQTLAFSYIGFERQELRVAGPKLNVVLDENNEALEEVVVVGYGVQKKKLLTGATAQVKGEDIQKLNTVNPLQALQGQTPGMSITSTSGQPGSSMKVIIRGLGTIGNSGPLYLIDGVGGDITTLNPADIESIDVLKDAASAAIYGAQAANGVVLVTTRRGREGKARVSFDAYYGWQSVARKAQLLDAHQYMTIMDEQAVNSGNAPIDWSRYSTIFDQQGNPLDTDWMDVMFKDNATTQSYNLSITGGSKASTYALSIGYMDQEGIVGGKSVSNYDRYNVRLNADQQIASFLRIGEQIGMMTKTTRGISVGNQYNNSLRGAFQSSPLVPIYGPNDFDSPYYDTSYDSWWSEMGNVYGTMMTLNKSESTNTNFTGNIFAEIEPIRNLIFRSQLGAVYGSNQSRSYNPIYKFSPYSQNSATAPSAGQGMSHGLGLTFTNTLTYRFTVRDHTINALVGMEAYRYEGVSVSASKGLLKDGFQDWEHAYVSNGTASSSDEGLGASGSPHDKSRSVSYFGRLGWDWKERYMVNATMRADGSSKFASGHRFGYFPSVSAGWTITNEPWMERSKPWLDFLKLRASWGQVGNQNISNYQYLSPIKNTNTHYNFGTGMGASAQSTNWGAYPSRLSNEDLTWETSEQTNIGLDARLIRNRLGINIDYYWKTTKDWLVQAPVLNTAGTGEPFINGGDVENRGIEVALSWNDRIGHFNYNISANMAYNKNKVGNIPTADGMIHGQTNMLYDNSEEFYRAQDGHPIGYFWGYKTAGIFQNQKEIEQWIAAGNGVLQGPSVQPGDVKYYDINHDGMIDEADKVDLGNGIPDITYGFNIALSYRGIDLSVVASGAAGHQLVQSYRNHVKTKANYTTAILERWTGEGTSNRMPRVTETNVNWQFSDLYIHDGDYLRIANITLGYDFAKLSRWKVLSQARLYVQVQNPFTFTKYDGMDPEIGYGTDGWVSGIDVGYYPRPRTIMIGTNLKF